MYVADCESCRTKAKWFAATMSVLPVWSSHKDLLAKEDDRQAATPDLVRQDVYTMCSIVCTWVEQSHGLKSIPDATQLILCHHLWLFTVNGPHPHIQHIFVLRRC